MMPPNTSEPSLQLTLQSIFDGGKTNRVDNLASESANQNSLSFIFRNTTAHEVKNSIRIDLADRRAVETTDVVVSNFKLRLRIDLSLSGEKQIFTMLDRVRLLGILVNRDHAIKHTLCVPGEHAFVQLAA